MSGLIRNLRRAEKPSKQTAVEITEEDEKKLWELGRLGKDTPTAFVTTLIYFAGKFFGLRGGEELRNVRYASFDFQSLENGNWVSSIMTNETRVSYVG